MNKLRQRWDHSQFICSTIFPFMRIGHFFYLLSPFWRFRVHTVIWIPRYPIQESWWWDLPKESSFETLKSYNKPMSSYNIGRSSISIPGRNIQLYTQGGNSKADSTPEASPLCFSSWNLTFCQPFGDHPVFLDFASRERRLPLPGYETLKKITKLSCHFRIQTFIPRSST